MNEIDRKRIPDKEKKCKDQGEIRDMKNIYASAREMLPYGIGNSVWGSGGEREGVDDGCKNCTKSRGEQKEE